MKERLKKAEAAAGMTPLVAATRGALRALEAVEAGPVPAELRAAVAELRRQLEDAASLARQEASPEVFRFTLDLGPSPAFLAARADLQRVEAGELAAVDALRQNLDRLASRHDPNLDRQHDQEGAPS